MSRDMKQQSTDEQILTRDGIKMILRRIDFLERSIHRELTEMCARIDALYDINSELDKEIESLLDDELLRMAATIKTEETTDEEEALREEMERERYRDSEKDFF